MPLVHGMFGLAFGHKYLRRVEETVSARFGAKHAFLLSSGKAALFTILTALRLLNPSRNRVLIPAYTCYSVPSSILRAGLEISLCDIDPITFDFDRRQLERSITENTLAVVPDHLFGIPADMDRIAQLCRDKGAYLVEDCSQAMGGRYGKLPLGAVGDVGFFSLGRGKNVTCGSGGIVITNSDAIGAAVSEVFRTVRAPGIRGNLRQLAEAILLMVFLRPSLHWFPAGLTFLRLGETIFSPDFSIQRLSGVQAGLLHDWEGRLLRSNEARTRVARWFIEALKLANRPEGVCYLRLPVFSRSPRSRDEALSSSKQQGLGLSGMYPRAIHEITEIRDQFSDTYFPVASEVSRRIVTLPTHEMLSVRDLERIATVGRRFSFQTHLGEQSQCG